MVSESSKIGSNLRIYWFTHHFISLTIMSHPAWVVDSKQYVWKLHILTYLVVPRVCAWRESAKVALQFDFISEANEIVKIDSNDSSEIEWRWGNLSDIW